LKPVEHWCELSEVSEKSGDYLGACDSALLGLDQYPHARELQYRAILNLSRAGANRRATQLWQSCGLRANLEGNQLEGGLEENIAALGARLCREEAFAAQSLQRQAKLREAAAYYESIYQRTKGTFPAINAAVLYELSGDSARAEEIGSYIVERCKQASPRSDDAAYQLEADRATAYLLLNNVSAAQAAIMEAARLASKASSIASTRKQLQQICEHKGIDSSILSPLRNRTVIHYTGHMVSPEGRQSQVSAEAEARVSEQIRKEIASHNVGYGYGSLACGADTLIVEALLERAADNWPTEINVVLPYEVESFRGQSVSRGGPDWLARFDRCLNRVTVTQATDGEFAGEPQVFAYASKLAMGLATLRAKHICSDLIQLAVWDGRETADPAGTWSDIREWRGRGLETIVVSCEGNLIASPDLHGDEARRLPPRKLRAIMFGDFEGFSRLKDHQMLAFFEHVVRCVARVLDRFDAHIVTRNTWGDGLYIVFDDLSAAAHCALELQSELGRLDVASLGLPATLGLRLGLHAGAVFEIEDAVLRSIGFTGSHISRTARLEPNTPAGEVYVTEAFAALLALSHSADFTCDYVGLIKAPKDYGRLRAYLLRTC
jgi:class 3 adenylate cyclase